MVYLPYDVLTMIAYENGDAGGKAGIENDWTLGRETDALLYAAVGMLPDRAGMIDEFKAQVAALVLGSSRALEIACG